MQIEKTMQEELLHFQVSSLKSCLHPQSWTDNPVATCFSSHLLLRVYLNFSIATDAFYPQNKSPPFVQFLVLTTDLLKRDLSVHYLYFLTSHSILNIAHSGFHPSTPLKLLPQVTLLELKRLCKRAEASVVSTASSGTGSQQGLNTLL